MTILLYLLLLAFVLIETPLVIMVMYLFNHRAENGEIARLRKILLMILLTKFFFMLGQIILITISLTKPPWGRDFVIWTYSLAAISLCIVNWWALIKIKKQILTDKKDMV